MNRSKIIEHYKSFFSIEDMPMAENDQLMIDWAENLLQTYQTSPINRFVCNKCGLMLTLQNGIIVAGNCRSISLTSKRTQLCGGKLIPVV